MKPISLYFQIHETLELNNYNIFDIGFSEKYFNIEKTKEILRNKIDQSYIPMNTLLLKLIKENKTNFNIAFSISGTTLDIFEKYFPEMIESFIELSKTGNVEFLAETYNHSLSSLFSKSEFEKQVVMHQKKIQLLFNQKPKVFRNSELLYSNEIGELVSSLGFKSILAQGINSVLKFKSSNHLYHTELKNDSINLLLGNKELSLDIQNNFGDSSWDHYPLQAPTYVKWIKESFNSGELVNIWLDYETFGFTHKKESGIFDFFEHVITNSIDEGLEFTNPSKIIENHSTKGAIDIPTTISWSNTFDDAHSWIGNSMQKQSAAELYELGSMISELDDSKLTQSFRELTNSQYFYNMCTHLDTTYSFHGNFSHHENPYENYIYFMNILRDLASRIRVKYNLLLEKKGTTISSNETSFEKLRTIAMK